MAEHSDILFSELGNTGLITLNRPQSLNAITHEMVVALYDQLGTWETEEDVKTVFIQGAGEKAFCAGGDIRKIYETHHDPELVIKKFFWDEYRLNHRIFHYPKPYIALLDGITMGGGVGISIHGTYRIATERFTFAMPETAIGFFPDVGGSYFLPRCPGNTGIYLGLTGARVKAADAAYLGLINHFVPTDKLPELIDSLATNNLGANTKQAIDEIIQAASIQPEEPPLAKHRDDIDFCFQYNTMEQIIAALQQRKNEWCEKTIETLMTKSPTSLKVTLQQLHRGKQLSFDQCMQMEYRMMMRFLVGHDLYEGIRAVIVDKDQKPNWKPRELSAVTAQEVDAYFAPLQNTPELQF